MTFLALIDSKFYKVLIIMWGKQLHIWWKETMAICRPWIRADHSSRSIASNGFLFPMLSYGIYLFRFLPKNDMSEKRWNSYSVRKRWNTKLSYRKSVKLWWRNWTYFGHRQYLDILQRELWYKCLLLSSVCNGLDIMKMINVFSFSFPHDLGILYIWRFLRSPLF